MKNTLEAQKAWMSHYTKHPEAKVENYKELVIVTYPYNPEKGYTGLAIWKGKQTRPYVNSYFRNPEAVAKYIDSQKKQFDSIEAWKNERKEKRANFVHSLEVGDILFGSWGYEQTNVDFYQVTEVKGKYVIVREIASKKVPMSGYSDMSAHVVAIKDAFIGEPMKKLVSEGNCITIASYESASPWDGRPKYMSWYA
jgi:hypothetical protein